MVYKTIYPMAEELKNIKATTIKLMAETMYGKNIFICFLLTIIPWRKNNIGNITIRLPIKSPFKSNVPRLFKSKDKKADNRNMIKAGKNITTPSILFNIFSPFNLTPPLKLLFNKASC